VSSSPLPSLSIDSNQPKLCVKVVHSSSEPLQPEPTTIHLPDFPPPEPPVDYEVEDDISRVKCQEEIKSNGFTNYKDVQHIKIPQQQKEQNQVPVHVPMRKSPHRATVNEFKKLLF
jgi:hypothetical protein